MQKKLFILMLTSISLSVNAGIESDCARIQKKGRKKEKINNGFGRMDTKASPVRKDNARGAQKSKLQQKALKESLIEASLAAANHNPISPKKSDLFASPVKKSPSTK